MIPFVARSAALVQDEEDRCILTRDYIYLKNGGYQMSGAKFRGRLLNGMASFTSADQVQPVRVRRYQKRDIKVSFNGMLDKGEQIAQVVWDTNGPWIVRMSDPGVSGGNRVATLKADFNYPGICSVRCQVTTGSGYTYNYEYRITVTNAPIMPYDTHQPATGPFRLVFNV